MRSLDPRLPVLVGLGAANDAARRRRPHDRGRARRGRRRRRAGPARRCRLHRRAPGLVVARRPGAHRRGAGSDRPRRTPSSARSASPNRRSSTTRWAPLPPAGTTPSSSPGPRRGRGRATAASRTTRRTRPPDEVLTRPPDFVAPGGDRGRHGVAAGAAVRADRERARRRPGSRGRAPSATRSPRSGPASTRWRRTTPRRRSGSPATP